MSPPNIIGVDIGGTKSAITRYDRKTLEAEQTELIPTHAESGFPHVLQDVISLIGKMRTPETQGIGVGVPGLVRFGEGLLLRAPNIPHSDMISVREQMAASLRLPVYLDNDAHCFALAEALYGEGKGRSVVIGITLGTGVGGGVVVEGKIYRGAHGHAAEFGHMLLKPGEPPYHASSARETMRGEVEEFISGTALGKRCEAAGKPEEYLEGQVCAFLRPEIFREVAWLCTNLTFAFDPSIIVFGGSTGRALKPHLKKIANEFALWQTIIPLPKIAVGKRQDAATLGAALLAMESTS